MFSKGSIDESAVRNRMFNLVLSGVLTAVLLGGYWLFLSGHADGNTWLMSGLFGSAILVFAARWGLKGGVLTQLICVCAVLIITASVVIARRLPISEVEIGEGIIFFSIFILAMMLIVVFFVLLFHVIASDRKSKQSKQS